MAAELTLFTLDGVFYTVFIVHRQTAVKAVSVCCIRGLIHWLVFAVLRVVAEQLGLD